MRTFSRYVFSMVASGKKIHDVQCAIPAFEGLLDEKGDREVMKLLYRMSEWHGLAKLRMHTDVSLAFLETVTKEMGGLLRKFRDFSDENYATHELPREMEARARREREKVTHMASQSVAQTPSSTASGQTVVPEEPTMPSGQITQPSTSGRKSKKLNLATVKMHFIGDYVQHIRRLGTTDSYSTQLVRESEFSLCQYLTDHT